MDRNEEPIIITENYKVSLTRLWKALTLREEMIQWFFENIPSFQAAIGFETQFDIHVEDRVFPHIWKVTEVVLHKKLAYEWTFDGYEGKGVSIFVLSKEGDYSRLTLTYEVIGSFPDDIPEFRRESGLEGWKYFLQSSLKEYLER